MQCAACSAAKAGPRYYVQCAGQCVQCAGQRETDEKETGSAVYLLLIAAA